MSLLPPMRYELFKYRKRKGRSRNSSVKGIPYVRYRRPTTRPLQSPHMPGQHGGGRNLYNLSIPQEYRPRINAPSVRSTEYMPYDPLETHHVHRPDNPRLPHNLNNHKMLLSMSLPQDDLTQTEQFLRAVGQRDEIEQVVLHESIFNINKLDSDESMFTGTQLPVTRTDDFEPSEVESAIQEQHSERAPRITQRPAENIGLTLEEMEHKLDDLMDAHSHLQKVLPRDHIDILNLQDAIINIVTDPRRIAEFDSLVGEIGPSKLGEGDPYERDSFEETGQVFDKQMQMVEEQFSGPEIMPVKTQPMNPEMGLEESLHHESFMEQGSLEGIVQQVDPFAVAVPGLMEQDMSPTEMAEDMRMPDAMSEPVGYDDDMAIDEINHAIDQVTEQPMEHEPDPFQPRYDPFMAPEYMANPQQYMPNYMLPGMHP